MAEILIAVAILGLALIPIISSMSTLFKERKKVDDRAIVGGYAKSIIDEIRYLNHDDLIKWIKEQGMAVNPGSTVTLPSSFYATSLMNKNKLLGTDADVENIAEQVSLVPQYNVKSAIDANLSRHAMMINVRCTWTDKSQKELEQRELELSAMLFNKKAAHKW